MGLSSKEVSGDSLDWSQIGSLEIPKPIGEARSRQEQDDQRQKVPPLKCPRCESTNTKFCYYNNYSRSQPRHFCRACRRHWTEGGTLRNVPVGGNRKNKRTKTSHTTTNSDDVSIGISTIHQQQQKGAAPLGVELENSIFPDILRQVFFHPPPTPSLLPSDYSGNNSLFSPSPFLPEIRGIEPVCDDVGNPFSISTSPSCSSPYRGLDLVGTMMGGSSASTWLQEPSALPASYWNCWDGNTDFAAADRSPDDS